MLSALNINGRKGKTREKNIFPPGSACGMAEFTVSFSARNVPTASDGSGGCAPGRIHGAERFSSADAEADGTGSPHTPRIPTVGCGMKAHPVATLRELARRIGSRKRRKSRRQLRQNGGKIPMDRAVGDPRRGKFPSRGNQKGGGKFRPFPVRQRQGRFPGKRVIGAPPYNRDSRIVSNHAGAGKDAPPASGSKSRKRKTAAARRCGRAHFLREITTLLKLPSPELSVWRSLSPSSVM